MRHAGGHEDDVARRDAELIQRSEQGLDVLAFDPSGKPVTGELLAEAEPDARPLAPSLDDRPRFGLAVGRAETLCRERAVRMAVDGQPLSGVEQLHEQPGFGPPRAEEPRRVGGDRVADQDAVLEPRESDIAVTEDGVRRADPVLRRVLVARRRAAEARDRVAAAIEAVQLVRRQPQRFHAAISPEPRGTSVVGRTICLGGPSSPESRSQSTRAARRPSSAAS